MCEAHDIMEMQINDAEMSTMSEITLLQGYASCYPSEEDTISTLIAFADKALYDVKRAGKDDYHIYEDENDRMWIRRQRSMGAVLCVKGKQVGIGKPLVCVPVMESTKEAIIEEVKRLVELQVDMVEWRVDAFAGIDSLNAIRDVLQEMAPFVRNTILVYTFRSRQQGGLLQLDADRIYDIHQVAAESHVVDFVDIEIFETKKPEREIRKLQEMGTHVIASHHDFDGTPEKTVIRMLLEQIYESGADIVKLALMPQCMQDVWNLLEETENFHEIYPNQPIITMSMGAMGGLSRVAGEYTGSCVSFGAGKTASAPGQFPMEKLTKILDILHESIGK